MARPQQILGIDPEDTIPSNASLIMPVRLAELVAWEKQVRDPDNVVALHQMRIAAKRLRYTMELFAPFYGKDFALAIDKVKGIQELLGQIHDADVIVPALQQHTRRVLKQSERQKVEQGALGGDFDSAGGLILICRRRQAERRALYRKFTAEWRALRAAGFVESLKEMVRRPDDKTARRKASAPRPAPTEAAAP